MSNNNEKRRSRLIELYQRFFSYRISFQLLRSSWLVLMRQSRSAFCNNLLVRPNTRSSATSQRPCR